ncbi:MAG TPA: hypothetical protein VFU73_00105 [Actinocrinis sp.]|nr:hypothetical protein [Actinocrinis sp.]
MSDGDALIWYRRAQQITWSRLLAGEITEVFVFGTPGVPDLSTLAAFVPQTLGLEPITSAAYRYAADGTLRDQEQLGAVARELAATTRWIAEGLETHWAAAFIERAGAVLFFDTPWARAVRPSDPLGRGGKTFAVLLRRLWYNRAARRFPTEADSDGSYQPPPAPAWSTWQGDSISELEQFVVANAPQKLVHVVSRDQIRHLRALRIAPTRA